MIYCLLILVSTFVSRAALVAIDPNSSSINNSLNRITPHCFTPDSSPGTFETNLKDCRDALLVLARTPDFTTPFSFSKNPRRGLKVPRGWRSGECVIFVSCENDRDAYTFRFADVLVEARTLVDNCVGKESQEWGILRWGGVTILGNSETFYVSVGKPFSPRTPIGVVSLELVNGTLLDPAIEGS